MKKILFIFLFLILLFSFNASGTNILSIAPAVSIVPLNATISVDIVIDPSENVAGAQCNLSFDKDVLQAIAVTNGNLFEYWANDLLPNFTVIDNDAGRIDNIVAFSGNATNESGVFATVVFEAIGTGTANITLFNVSVSDEGGNETDVHVTNGSIIVDGSAPVIAFLDVPDPETHHRDVVFRWSATDDVSSQENITFSHMLSNYSEQWTAWSPLNETQFTGLSSGTYTFMLKARDEAGNTGYGNYSFSIIDASPPRITNVTASPSLQIRHGLVNISCTITDDFGIAKANVTVGMITYPLIHESGATYYLNQSYEVPGIYQFFIYAQDVSGLGNTSDAYQFEVVNQPPAPPSNPSPSNGSLVSTPHPILSVAVTDPDGDDMDVTFYQAKDGSVIGTDTGVPSGGTASMQWNNRRGHTTYSWYAVASDGYEIAQSPIWRFITANNPPTAEPQSLSTDEDVPLSLTLTGSDPDDDTLSFAIASGPQHGSLSGTPPELIYTPDSHYHGTDSFTFTVSDGYGGSDEATISLTIHPVSQPPNAPTNPSPANGASGVSRNPTLSVKVSDSDGDALQVFFYDAVHHTLIGSDTNVPSGGTASVTWSGLAYAASYMWYVNVSDGVYTVHSDTWQFTTMSTPQYTLTTLSEPPEGGYVLMSPLGGMYLEGTTVSLTAVPLTGYRFDHWSGDVSGSDIHTTVRMNGNRQVVAHFIPDNDPPYVPVTFTPENGSTVYQRNVTLSVVVTDPDGDVMNVSFYRADDDSIIGTAHGVVSGTTASVEWSNLSHNTTYFWYVVLQDEYGETTSPTQHFTVADNRPPSIKLVFPLSGATISGTSPSLRVLVTDPDNDTINISFYDASDGSLIGTVTDVPSGEIIGMVWRHLGHSTTYSWYAIASDGMHTNCSTTWQFSTGAASSFPYWYLLIFIVIIAAIVTAYYLLRKKKTVVIEAQEAQRCFVCLGKFKDTTHIVKCKNCGTPFHKTCAQRVGECPSCGKKLS